MSMLTDIPQSVIDAFDCDAFEKRRGEPGWVWNDNTRYQSLVYIRKKFKRNSSYEITERDFRPAKLTRAYRIAMYEKKHSLMIKIVLEAKGISIDLDRFITKLSPEQESRFFLDRSIPDMTTYKNLKDVPKEILDNFNVTEFEKWNGASSKKFNKWVDVTRFYLIIYLMKKCNIHTVSKLRKNNFLEYGVYAAYSDEAYENKFFKMIVSVLQQFGIVVVENDIQDAVRIIEIDEKRKSCDEMLKNTPRIPQTIEYLEIKFQMIALIKSIPDIVKDFLIDPFKMQIHIDKNADCAVIYVNVVDESNLIIYVGSSHYWVKRSGQHRRTVAKLLEIEENKHDNSQEEQKCHEEPHKFHNYASENKLSFGNGLTMLPIIKCPIGFKKIIEAEVFDALEAVNDKSKVDLQNGCRPMDKKLTIDSDAVIYKYVDEKVSSETPIYGGSSDEFENRDGHHRTKCYTKKLKTKFYDYLRSLGGNDLPSHIKIRPVEIVPIGLALEREKKFIIENDLIDNGYNSCLPFLTHEERKAKQSVRNAKSELKRQAKKAASKSASEASCSTDVPIIVAKPLRLKKDIQ